MTKREPTFWIIFTAGAMEICWLFAWVDFVVISAFKQSISILYVVALYLTGVLTKKLIVSGLKIRGLIYLAWLVAFSASFIVISRWLALPGMGKAHILEYSYLFGGRLTAVEWLILFTMLCFSLVIWRRSIYYISHDLDPRRLYLCFDGAITALISLMVVKLLMWARFGVLLPQRSLTPILIATLILGLITIGIKIGSSANERRAISRIQKLAITLSFILLTLGTGIGLISFFRPQMTKVASAVSRNTGIGGRFLLDLFVSLLHLMWGNRKMAATPASSSSGPDMNIVLKATEPSRFEWLIKFGFGLIVVVLMVLTLYTILRILFRFLFARVKTSNEGSSGLIQLLLYVVRLLGRLVLLIKSVPTLIRRQNTAMGLYKQMRDWGTLSGITPGFSETPLEFQHRIAERFPELSKASEEIINLLYQEVFQVVPPSIHQIRLGKKMLRKMRHPKMWFRRIKNWLFSVNSEYMHTSHSY